MIIKSDNWYIAIKEATKLAEIHDGLLIAYENLIVERQNVY